MNTRNTRNTRNTISTQTTMSLDNPFGFIEEENNEEIVQRCLKEDTSNINMSSKMVFNNKVINKYIRYEITVGYKPDINNISKEELFSKYGFLKYLKMLKCDIQQNYSDFGTGTYTMFIIYSGPEIELLKINKPHLFV